MRKDILILCLFSLSLTALGKSMKCQLGSVYADDTQGAFTTDHSISINLAGQNEKTSIETDTHTIGFELQLNEGQEIFDTTFTVTLTAISKDSKKVELNNSLTLIYDGFIMGALKFSIAATDTITENTQTIDAKIFALTSFSNLMARPKEFYTSATQMSYGAKYLMLDGKLEHADLIAAGLLGSCYLL